MKPPVRVIFWVILAVFAGSCLFWMRYFPYRPGQQYRFLPVSTTFVSVHQDLAGRWRDVLENPITFSLLTTMGVEEEALTEVPEDPETDQLIEWLASGETTLAYVPLAGFDVRPFWMFTTWIGKKGQDLRYGLSFSPMQGIYKEPKHAGRSMWRYDLGNGESIYFAIVDGFVVGCMARHPGSLRFIMDTYDGVYPSAATMLAVDKGCFGKAGDPAGVTPDKGLMLSGLDWLNSSLCFGLSGLSSDSVGGWVGLSHQEPLVIRQDAIGPAKELVGLFGDLPMACAAMHANHVGDWLKNTAGQPWNRFRDELTLFDADTPVMLALLGDKYSGRYNGFKIPALVAAFHVGADSGLKQMTEGLDQFNSWYGLGLIPRAVAEHGQTMVVIESSLENDYADLPYKERWAYMAYGDWIIFSTSTLALQKLAERIAEGPESSVAPDWYREMMSRDSQEFLWIDLSRSLKVVRTALKFQSVKLMVDEPLKSKQIVEELAGYQAWLKVFEPFETGRIWLSDPNPYRLEVHLGPEVETP